MKVLNSTPKLVLECCWLEGRRKMKAASVKRNGYELLVLRR